MKRSYYSLEAKYFSKRIICDSCAICYKDSDFELCPTCGLQIFPAVKTFSFKNKEAHKLDLDNMGYDESKYQSSKTK